MYSVTSHQDRSALVHQALTEARDCARVAAVDVRELFDYSEIVAAADLLNVIWTETRPVPEHLMRAIQFFGGYVSGAFCAGDIVGASVGLIGRRDSIFLHSHAVGIHPAMRGRGIGSAIKFHQRFWAISNNIDQIKWTFDPFLGRNAYLNLTKLGARVEEFIPGFYGEPGDENTAGTDRFAVAWDVTEVTWPSQRHKKRELPLRSRDHVQLSLEFALKGDAYGRPRLTLDAGNQILACQIPDDVAAMRRDSPALANEWGTALREALITLLHRGYELKGFARGGYYVLQHMP